MKQNKNIREVLQTPVMGEYDVIVCGGGIGGVAAAVAAKRADARVLLLEKSVMLGGLATLGLISWYEPICDGNGHKIMYGMADELLQLAIGYGADSLAPGWRDNPDAAEDTDKRFSTFFSPTIMTLALDRWVIDAGVDLLLDTMVAAPIMDGSRCGGIVVENKSGRGAYLAKAIIDATGDADVIERSGVPCVEGKNYLTYVAYLTDIEKCEKVSGENNILKSRKWMNVGSDLWGNGHPEGMPVFTGVSAEDVTRYVISGRKLFFGRIKEGDRWQRDITVLPGMAQFRTTRRINGEYTLTESDEGKTFDDSVGIAGDFNHRGKVYELPYRILYHGAYDNLLTVGRSVSSSGWAWEVTRVIPVAAATGQAAGIAAAICAGDDLPVGGIDIRRLQQRLNDDGVKIHID